MDGESRLAQTHMSTRTERRLRHQQLIADRTTAVTPVLAMVSVSVCVCTCRRDTENLHPRVYNCYGSERSWYLSAFLRACVTCLQRLSSLLAVDLMPKVEALH